MGKDENKGRKRRILLCVAVVLILLCAVAGFFYYSGFITAVTMRIQRLVGEVTLLGSDGAEQSIREKMRLGEGQTVTTGGESLIMVSLDDNKLMTMEESSRADIRARGKKLEFHLVEGDLFFNVTEKLKDNESFEIHTTTMVCGIRGTSAYVGRDRTGHDIIMVTDGIVHVVATNPVTKESLETDVFAGEMRTVYLDDEAEGNATISLKKKTFREEDLPPMALDTMRKNPELMERVARDTGFSTKKITTLADLSCTKGVSMYGSAVDELRQSGIEDAIPYMGDRSDEMISSANSAVNIAGSDLPLEVAIITGCRDVMNEGHDAGIAGNELGILMDSTRDCMEETLSAAEEGGINSVGRLNIAMDMSETLRTSTRKMAASGLSAGEISRVINTSSGIYKAAVQGSSSSYSVSSVSDHITGIINVETPKKSNGEQISEALLASSDKKSSAKDTGNKPSSSKVVSGDDILKIKEAAPVTGDAAANKAAGTGATSAELKNAGSMIIATDPNTGIVALSDGTLFDPVYYAAANPDFVAAYGTQTNALLAHYLSQGKAQGRPPIAPQALTKQEETKPDWLLRQEQEERERQQDDDDDDDDDDDSSNASGGSSGGSPVTVASIDQNAQPDANGAYPVTDGNGVQIGRYTPATANSPAKFSIKDTNQLIDVTLPVEITDQSGAKHNINNLLDVDWMTSDVGVTVADPSKKWTDNQGRELPLYFTRVTDSSTSSQAFKLDYQNGNPKYFSNNHLTQTNDLDTFYNSLP